MTRAAFIACMLTVSLFALLQIGFVGTTIDTNLLQHVSARMIYDGTGLNCALAIQFQ